MTDLPLLPTESVELDLYPGEEIRAEDLAPLEWPDTTRLELTTPDGIAVFWRDDAHAIGEGRWWFTGIPRCALTWFELYEAYGQALREAVPLYPPVSTQVAVRPVQVLLTHNASGSVRAWCFSDSDDARAAYEAGAGENILPSVLLAPGVELERVRYHTGWARLGRNPADDTDPHISQQTMSWAAPGVAIPLHRVGDDLDGLSTPGIDVIDLWCIGVDPDAVLADLGGRYAQVLAQRLGALGWHAAPAELLM